MLIYYLVISYQQRSFITFFIITVCLRNQFFPLDYLRDLLSVQVSSSRVLFSVSDPDPDPVGSGIIYRIRIWIRKSNFGSGAGKDLELGFLHTYGTELFSLPNNNVYLW